MCGCNSTPKDPYREPSPPPPVGMQGGRPGFNWTAGGGVSEGRLCGPWKPGPVDPWTGKGQDSRICCTPQIGRNGYGVAGCIKAFRPSARD